MAHKHIGPKPNGADFYNVDRSVGISGANAAGDVKLVQYMLRNIYGAEAAGLAVDGWIGQVTNSWIKRFQSDAKARGVNVAVDCRVDPAVINSTSTSKNVFTIIAMNWTLRKNNPAAYDNLPAAVQLHSGPGSSPYSGNGKVVVETTRKLTPHGWEITRKYSDGSVEKFIVKGNLVEDGVVYHGRTIADYVMPWGPLPPIPGNPYLKPALRIIWYEDGYQVTIPLYFDSRYGTAPTFNS